MKVLLINGSPKENGNTSLALKEVAKTLNTEGITTEIINIGKVAVQGCIACGMCGRTGKCTYNDDLYYKVWRKDSAAARVSTLPTSIMRKSGWM